MNQHFTPLHSPSPNQQPQAAHAKKSSFNKLFAGFAALLLAVGIGVGAWLITNQQNLGTNAATSSTTVLVEVHSFVGSGTDSDGRYDGWFAVILDDGTTLIDWMQTGFYGPKAVEIPAGHTARLHWDTRKNGSEQPYIIDPKRCTAEGIRATTTDYRDIHYNIPESPRSAGRRSVEAFCGPIKAQPTSTPTPTPSPTPVPKCGDSCPVGSGTSKCPTGHKCSAGGRCELEACSTAGTSCDGSKCKVLSPTPVPPTPTVVPQCGASCSTDANCPTNHSCASGKCVLTKCLQPGVQCNQNKCKELACVEPPPVSKLMIKCPNCSK